MKENLFNIAKFVFMAIIVTVCLNHVEVNINHTFKDKYLENGRGNVLNQRNPLSIHHEVQYKENKYL